MNIPSDPSGIIAANNVFISAEIININGRIQSGLHKLNATITEGAINTPEIISARNHYNNTLSLGQDASHLKYYQLTGSSVSSGNINTFLNFETDEIEVATTKVQGGLVQLSGKIISTGNGKIEALDGYGRIKIDNQTGKTLVLNQINTGDDIEGKIIITDTNRTGASGANLQTIYTRNGNSLKVVNNTTVDSDGNANHLVRTSNGRTSSYTPKSNQRFSWVLGNDEGVERTDVLRVRRTQAIGITFDTDNLGTRIGRETSSLNIAELEGGGFVVDDPNANDYTFSYDRYLTRSFQRSLETVERCIRRIIACVRREYTTTIIFDEVWRNIYHHSIRANRAVKIKFNGYDQGIVDIDSGGGVAINGELSNLQGQTTITTRGDIAQRLATTKIRADRLSFYTSSGSIGGEDAPIRLDQEMGSHLTAHVQNNIAIEAINGDLVIGNIVSASEGSISLISDDSILATNTGISVIWGRDIQLASRLGRIGTELDNIQVDTVGVASQVRAEAAKDIYLSENTGDLRVDRIVSHNGNVTLSVMDGSIIDANAEEMGEDISENELAAIYQEMRLMGSDAQVSVNEAMENYRQQKNREYEDYWAIRGYDQAYDLTTQVSVSTIKRSQLKTYNNWSDEDVDAYEVELTQQYHRNHQEFFGSLDSGLSGSGSGGGDSALVAENTQGVRGGSYDQNYRYGFSDEEMESFSTDTAWRMEELSNTFSAGAAVSNVLDAQAVVEIANIEGQDVTLSSSGALGKASDDIVITIPQNGRVTLTDEIREALTVAEKDGLILEGNTLTIKRSDDLDITASGNLQASAGEELLLGSEQNLAIESVSSTSMVQLKTEGGLTETGSGDSAIRAGELTIEADDGAIGSDDQDFRVHVDDGGKFSARSEQNIRLDSSLNDLGVNEILTREELHLNVNGGNNIYDYDYDEKRDIQAGRMVLTAEGDIGDRTLASRQGALEVTLDGDSQLSASSSNGVVNVNAVGGNVKVGNISANAGAAVYSDSNIMLEGDIRVTNASSNLGAVLDAKGKIDAGEDDGDDVVIAGDSAQLNLRAGEGIGGENSLVVNASHLNLSNESGDVDIVGQRGLLLESISQRGEGEVQVTSQENITLGGGDVSLGDANLTVITEGEGELAVVGDLSSANGAIELQSNQGITFNNEITITTEGADADVTLDANDRILGQDLYFNTAGVHLISHNTSIGSDDQALTMTSSGVYETLHAESGIYLMDVGKGLRIDTVNEGTEGTQVNASGRGNLQLGSLALERGGIDVSVGGSSFVADSLRGNSVTIRMDDPNSLADVDIVAVEDSFLTHANSLSVANLQSNGAVSINISNLGVGGGMAENVNIASELDIHMIFSRLNTQQADLYFEDTQRLSFSGSSISDYLYLSSSELSFLLNQNNSILQDADVLLHIPDSSAFNLEVNGASYDTSALILVSEGDSGGIDNGSVLDNTGDMVNHSMEEIGTFLEDADLELKAKADKSELELILGIGIDIDDGQGIAIEGDDIRNDFLRTIEIDRLSNNFFSSSSSSSSSESDSDRPKRKPSGRKSK